MNYLSWESEDGPGGEYRVGGVGGDRRLGNGVSTDGDRVGGESNWRFGDGPVIIITLSEFEIKDGRMGVILTGCLETFL